jgi:hypothetical protein
LNPRAIPYFIVAGVFGLITIGLQLLPVQRTVTDATYADAIASAPPAPPETLALPRLELGESVAQVSASFEPGVTPRHVTSAGWTACETWEWSEPAGRYALAGFVDGGLRVASVRRPWGDWLPAVEAARLPQLREGSTRSDVEQAIGPGWPVSRVVGVTDAGEVLTCAWSIRDRGVGTGSQLLVGYQRDRVVVIAHPWAGR